jgi:two-component sensor histidine kinase
MHAFELDVNGETIASAGKPSLDPAAEVSSYRPGVFPVDGGNGSLDVIIRVSNYGYRGGGIWRTLFLGDRAAQTVEQQAAIYVSIVLTVVVATLALNSLIIFVFRRKEKSYFFFALFGFLIALRPLATGEYALMRIFPSMPFDLLVRIEYATAMFAVPSAAAFFLSFLPTEHKRLWSLVLLLPYLPFALFELFLPLYWLTWTIFAFYAVAIATIAIAVVVVLARAAYLRVQGGIAMFIAGCLLALCAINDILYSSHIIQTGHWVPFSLALFVLLQSIVLAKRFTSAFDKVELLSLELTASNGMLKEQIQNVMAASARLEESLSEKELLLKEVHHRVKNSLQIVSSIVSLQAHRSSDPAVESMSRSIRERIRVISIANEKLYDIESGDKIDLVAYARDILGLMVAGYKDEGRSIEGKVEGGRVEVESAVGIDFGLVLTELVTNALKHAIVPKGGGRIVISIREEGPVVHFKVEDDGPGFPAGFEPEKAQSLGFKIAHALLQRLDGSIEFSTGPGAVVTCSMRSVQESEFA